MSNRIQDIYIVGAGGNGKEIADTIVAINEATLTFRLAGFIDDNKSIIGKMINGTKVVETIDDFVVSYSKTSREKPMAIISVADPQTKAKLVQKLDGFVTWTNIIHPNTHIAPNVTLGIGILIQSFVHIASNTTVGSHVMINNHSSLGHDVTLCEYSSVMVNSILSGHVKVKRFGYLASSVTILPGITIGENSLIGAGTIVTKDIPSNVVAYGNPAKVIHNI
jgi:sugar O-acyltransferase (sialic acid O-acetyltransferase NeuD family)